MLGGLTIHPRVANVLQYISAKNYENWLAVDKVIAKIIRLTFFWPTLYIRSPSPQDWGSNPTLNFNLKFRANEC